MGGADTHQHECTMLAQYVEGYEDPLVQIVKAAKVRQVHGLMSWIRLVNNYDTIDDINKYHKRGLDNMRMICFNTTSQTIVN